MLIYKIMVDEAWEVREDNGKDYSEVYKQS